MTGRRNRSRLPIEPDARSAAQLEIDNHIEETTERLMEDGWSAEDARAEAMRRFGSVHRVRRTMVRETHAIERRSTLWDFINSIPSETRYAWRGLVANPLFTAVVIGTLGLGMGAAATGFTIVDALLVRPLPYMEPDRLVEVNVMQGDNDLLPILSPDRVHSLEQSAPGLDGFAYYDQRSYTLTGDGEPRDVSSIAVSASLDEVLGMHPALGRTFDDADMVPGTHRAMVSWQYWKQHGSNRHIIGSSLRLNGIPFEVVGVLPKNFKFPVAGSPREVWVALARDDLNNLPYANGVGRLASGLSLEAANARLATVSTAPPSSQTKQASSTPAASNAKAPVRPPVMIGTPLNRWRGNPELVHGVWLLMGAIVLMLLVAVVNAMNLILFRGADRMREIAVRVALGVSRLQLLRLVLVENVLIALLSGIAAVLITVLGVAGVNRRLPPDFAFSSAYTFDVTPRVLLFAFILACVTGLILGLLPAFGALRMRYVSDELRASRSASRDTRIAQGLVVAEVALAVTLLTGAGLLAHSFMKLTHVDPGIDTDHLALMTISLPAARYATAESRADFFNRFETALEANPAIASASVVGGAPPNPSFSFGVEFQAEGSQPLPTSKDDPMLFPFVSAAPDFVATAGVTMVSGRELDAADVGTDNVLIDSNLAHALWGGDVAGKRFRTGADDKWLTAVGIYHHIRAMGLDDHMTPYSMIRPRNLAKAGSYMSVMVRPRGDVNDVLPVMRSTLHALDPEIPAAKLERARDAFSETVDKPRFLARVMTGLSTTALVLAAVGVYGVLSYAVTRRKREMGIRMALGAPPMGLGLLFVRQGLLMTIAGLVVGLAAGLSLVRFVRTLLFALEPVDMLTFSAVAVLVVLVAIVASVIPARVVGRLSPATVLRSD